MPFGFASPLVLLGLLALPAIVWLERRAWAALPRWRRFTVLGCRLAEITLLLFAVAGFRWERAREEVCVLFAVDASRSVPEEARAEALAKIAAAADAMAPDDRAGLLVFGRAPLVEAVPQARLKVEKIQSLPDADFTDLASLLRLAAGVYPEGMRRRLVIFSDGNENRGQALEAVRPLKSAGVQIDVFPIEAPPRNEVSLSKLEIPGRVEKEEPFEIKVHALATDSGPATLRFFRDGATLGRREVFLEKGQNQFALAFTEESPGFHTYEAVIESPADAEPENNLAGGFTQVSGPSRVLLVGEASENSALANAFTLAKLNFESAAALPGTLAAMQPYDAIFLNNMPAAAFAPEQLEALELYVRDLGGGLGMIGGEFSYGPGGWIGTPVERALPVRMELKSKEKFPSLAMAMVIDKSGSMGGISGASKMDMANRAAVEAVNLLGPRDLVGVVAFDSAGKWVVHLGPATDKPAITRDILSIVPGGGTDAYQGAIMAVEALEKANAQIKHVILMTDGQTSPADFPGLLARMNAARITLSSIAIGADADQTFLETIARQGNGRFYFCPDPARVPRIFVRETILVQRSYLKEETATPAISAAHPILDGSGIAAMPPLHGWVVTEPKDRAETILKMQGDPLLATWLYGLGKGLAFTSDAKNRWAKDWTNWSDFQTFWDRTARWSLRAIASTELYPRLEFDRGRGTLKVEAASGAGERLNFLNLKAKLIRPDLTVEEVPLRQTAIGTYEADFEADSPGAYLAGIQDTTGRQGSTGGMVAYSPEFKDFESNDYLLHELARQTNGKVAPRIDEIFRREGEPVRSAKELTGTLLAAALLLLLFEVGVRRLHFDEEQLAKARAVFARLVPVRLAPAGGPGFDAAGMPAELKRKSRSVKARLNRAGGAGEEAELDAAGAADTAAGTTFSGGAPRADLESARPLQIDPEVAARMAGGSTRATGRAPRGEGAGTDAPGESTDTFARLRERREKRTEERSGGAAAGTGSGAETVKPGLPIASPKPAAEAKPAGAKLPESKPAGAEESGDAASRLLERKRQWRAEQEKDEKE